MSAGSPDAPKPRLRWCSNCCIHKPLNREHFAKRGGGLSKICGQCLDRSRLAESHAQVEAPRFAVEQTEVGPQLTIFPAEAPRDLRTAAEPDALEAIARAAIAAPASTEQAELFEAAARPKKARLMATIGQGADTAEERKQDLYESPPIAVRALQREWLELSKRRRIWEPACGPGVIVRELRAAGHAVFASDLVDYGSRLPEGAQVGKSFLEWTEAPAGVELIVSNPPYLIADDFIRHSLRLAPRVAMLLRLAYQQGARRSDIIDRHLSRLLVFKERLPFMHRDGFEGKKAASSAIPFAWFIFERTPKTPGEYLTRRISIREPAKGLSL